jgi:hypothetical protein
MDEIAPEYDVVVLGTGKNTPAWRGITAVANISAGLTECVLSGYAEGFKAPQDWKLINLVF